MFLRFTEQTLGVASDEFLGNLMIIQLVAGLRSTQRSGSYGKRTEKSGVHVDVRCRKASPRYVTLKYPADPSVRITTHAPGIGLCHTGWLREAGKGSRFDHQEQPAVCGSGVAA